MEEDSDIMPEKEAVPKKKILFLAALILGVVLLGGGGWLAYQKMGAMTAEPEQVHRRPTAAEIAAAATKKLAEMDQQAALRQAPSAVVVADGEVGVDELSMVVLENGQRQVKARLINRGRKKLIFARVDIQFLSSSKEVLFTRAVNPLVVSGGIFGDQSEALEAGGSRQFRVSADDTPSSWAGDVSAQVTDFQFGVIAGEGSH